MPDQPAFVRVKDTSTGHELDVPPQDSRIADGTFELIKDKRFPPVEGYLVQPREPQHYVDKAGKPAAPKNAQEG